MSDYGGEEVRLSPGFSDDNAVFRSEVSAVLACIRDELDDHREAINQTTNEVESNFECMAEVAKKVDLLSERLDAIALQVSGQFKSDPGFRITALSGKEKMVFSALYSLTEENPEVTYQRLASKMGISTELVAGYVTNLMEKGVPVKKRYVGAMVRLSLDPRFREEQAKGNLVRLDHPLTAWM